ncbi:hypothetical protein [Bacillus alveayuensis]|uniref:hypothetical protein n=1 Tax=Aeribacillus alveayuensis TaxID=279215 RepID=UPI0005CD6CBE|nr:hypothetical protein [Bacillus alveayuensis]
MEQKDYFKNKVTTEDELRSIIGNPSELAKQKVISYLDQHCRYFISLSLFLVIFTSDASGFCDV